MRILIDTTKVSKDFEQDFDIEYYPQDEPKKLIIEIADEYGSIPVELELEDAIKLREHINDTVDMMVRGSVV